MIEPTQADIGRRVVYTGNRYPDGLRERGVIKIVTPFTVFVTYDGEGYSKGTDRKDLEWEDEAVQGRAGER